MNIIALNVSYNNETCGYLAKFTNQLGKRLYLFKYDENYIVKKFPRAISISLPIQKEVFYSDSLFGFFDNLLSEGWLRREQTKALDINESDSFTLLMSNGTDLPGAIMVTPDESLSNLLAPYIRNI